MKTNELVLMPIATSVPQGKGMKLWDQEVKGHGHMRMKIGMEAWWRHRSGPWVKYIFFVVMFVTMTTLWEPVS